LTAICISRCATTSSTGTAKSSAAGSVPRTSAQNLCLEQSRVQLAQETTPYQHSFYFEAPWRRGYVDPLQADQVDGSSIGFTR
jgi:hypothetical protein